jgi:hypothetical protein
VNGFQNKRSEKQSINLVQRKERGKEKEEDDIEEKGKAGVGWAVVARTSKPSN